VRNTRKKEKSMTRTLFATVLLMGLAPPVFAAPANTTPASASTKSEVGDAAAPESDRNISFDHYREWRLNYIERRRSELAMQLSATDLAPRQKTRLEQIKAYYEWFAGLPEADRDRRFRERFDRIDANHDGQIDPAERTAWHEKQRALYQRRGNAEQAASTR
jgi:hypothetical protein